MAAEELQAPLPDLDRLGITPPEVWEQQDLVYRLYPERLWPPLMRPCVVKILMVTDAGGSFGTGYFGLKRLLDILAIPPGPWVHFEITTANRRQDTSAQIQMFRFDTTDLTAFDAIWMFAVETDDSSDSRLTQAELRSLAQFMDGGGGVFATGDHRDLGAGMCGDLPRVRSMRKWHWPGPGPLGEPVAPDVEGPDRLDTNYKEGGTAPFAAQSDDHPQEIQPRMYPSWQFWYPWRYRVHPHPLLCGPRGIIRHLPDHPHEGECYVPQDLTKSFTFNGYTTQEYPTLPNSKRLAPEVIATSFSYGVTTEPEKKGPARPRTFGAIGAWDGHRVRRGRVVVDATWHHFFNINHQGFSDTQPSYQDIKSYYRNIAVWLARPERHACMRWRALWAIRWHHQIFMDLQTITAKQGVQDLNLAEFVRVGAMARDVLGRLASQCQTHIWFLDIIRAVTPDIYPGIEPLIDPWSPTPPGPDPDPAPSLQADMLVQSAVGGAIYALAAQFRAPDANSAAKAEDIEWETLLQPGITTAINQAQDAIDRSTRELSKLGEVLRSAKPQ